MLNLDEKGKTKREEVDDALLNGVREQIREAGESLRSNQLPRLESWCTQCDQCDLAGICRSAPPRARTV